MFDGVTHQLRRAGKPQLIHQISPVTLHRSHTEMQRLSYLTIGVALGNQT